MSGLALFSRLQIRSGGMSEKHKFAITKQDVSAVSHVKQHVSTCANERLAALLCGEGATIVTWSAVNRAVLVLLTTSSYISAYSRFSAVRRCVQCVVPS
jgi:hypothetical protein